MNNFNNKSWWDNNPMTYKDWNLSLEKRIANNIDEFRKINEDYLNNNPYLKNLFTELSSNNYLENRVVLDIGCGWGSSVLLISKFAKKVYGIDISDMAIEGAKMNLKFFQKNNVEIKRNDAEKLEFEDQFFNYVYSWGVIHHSNNPSNIIGEMYRVLKDNGRGMIMVYNKNSLRYYIKGIYYLLFKFKIFRGYNLETVQKFFTDGYYHKHFTYNELYGEFKKVGFSNIDIKKSHMFKGILPGIKPQSKIDIYLKNKFGWFLIVNFTK